MDSDSQNDALTEEKQMLQAVANKGFGAKIGVYGKLCGPVGCRARSPSAVAP